MLELYANTQDGHTERVSFDRMPDSCPICHHAIEPTYLKLVHLRDSYEARLEIVFRCPRQKCQSIFIGRYFPTPYGGSYLFRYSVPYTPFDVDFSDSIKNISPGFCAIADQAQKAEHEDWKLIVGPGYRKALEFLIKDYLCKLLPNDAEKIKSAQLGPCIANFVVNERVKSTAARAAWLGNDETHYVRKWEDKDLEDLKNLITLTVHWIEMEEMTDSVIKGMPAGKK